MSIHAQIALANPNSKGEDVVVNTFTIYGPNTDAWGADEFTELRTALVAFYDAMPSGQGQALAKYLSPTVLRGSALHTFKAWKMNFPNQDDPMGSPDAFGTFQINTAPVNMTALPNEVALVVSLEAQGHDNAAIEVGATRPRARHKGRIFVGPFNTGAISAGAAGQECRPNSDLVTTLLAGLADLRDAIELTDATAGLGIWSRTDDTVRRLTAASIDNSFDVMRSRSIDPTAKTRVLL